MLKCCYYSVYPKPILGFILWLCLTSFISLERLIKFNHILSPVQFQWNLAFLVHCNKLFSQIQPASFSLFVGLFKIVWPL